MSGLFRSVSGSPATRLPEDTLPPPIDPTPHRSPSRSTGDEDIGMTQHETILLTRLPEESESVVPSKQLEVPDATQTHGILQSSPATSREEDIKNSIKRHEGFKDHVYLDSRKKPTIGYGHLLVAGDKFVPGTTYDKSTLDDLFEKDFQNAKSAANDLLKGMDIDERAQGIVTEMVFQLGKGGVSKFSDMLSALSKKDYARAADEMLDSLWHTQTPKRSRELARAMRSLSGNSTKN